MFKIHIENRNYQEWTCMEEKHMTTVTVEGLDPVQSKLLSGDSFSVNLEGIVEIKSSPLRQIDTIPGVLDLKTNKTYGREKTGKKRLLYRVVPDDIRLPVFLVPYEQKYMGFSKVFSNLYVIIKYENWDEKHPYGKITSTIGTVDILANFYEYQLYCRSLYASITRFNKDACKKARQLSESKGIEGVIKAYEENIEDRRGDEWKIYTIDPINSVDFDDGFSIKEDDNELKLSIYIANVTILLDAMNLWDSFSTRVSTIYLPDRKRPMLPTILSDNLCSLQENTTRFALAMDILIDKNTFTVKDVNYKNCVVKVLKNYRYQEKDLIESENYQLLEGTVKNLAKKYKYIRNIHTSHEVVSYLMTMMNYYCAKNLLENKQGLFRNSVLKTTEFNVPTEVDDEVSDFIKIWYSSGGQYINADSINDDINAVRHELMNMDAYIHMTSPIRRLVDLLNMIKFQETNELITLSSRCLEFYKEWTNPTKLDYINTSMRSIRKIQSDCSMLEFYTNNKEVTEKIYSGVMFDKVKRHDGMYKYVVYLPELKLTMRMYVYQEFENFEKKNFKLFLFQDEDNLKKKIRLQIV